MISDGVIAANADANNCDELEQLMQMGDGSNNAGNDAEMLDEEAAEKENENKPGNSAACASDENS